ncbi:MAG: peptidoglycan DD-metalloendopeptidase family protein [Bacteroidaceae bacterium]|nr:peptidoglycan DD-metalloendopeptidase family protein [Bacteroidaceae bacterium]
MLKNLLKTTAFAACIALAAPNASAQDLLARQAPVDKKMRAVDSIAIQKLLQTEELEDPAAELYPNWNDDQINLYGGVALPSEYKIDLRGFCMPTTNRIVTSNYGYRPRFRRQHKGIDINANKGDTIRAAFDGKVRVVDYQPSGYGNVVVIRHPNGLETVYGHLSKHLTKRDKVVKAGDPIGLAGDTGFSFGTHLHFETRLLGEYIDPAKLFDFANQDVTGDFYVFKGRGRGTLLGKHDGKGEADANEEVRYNSSESAAAKAQAKRDAQQSARTRIHKVKRGETLSSIARRHGTTVAKLRRINGLRKSSKIRPGQILKYS